MTATQVFQNKQRVLSGYKKKAVPTKAEKEFADLLNESGLKYVSQKGWIADGWFCISDFYLPKPHRICIEIDGLYHNSDKQKQRDKANTEYLKNTRGMRTVLRFSNEFVTTKQSEVRRILGLISERRYDEL